MLFSPSSYHISPLSSLRCLLTQPRKPCAKSVHLQPCLSPRLPARRVQTRLSQLEGACTDHLVQTEHGGIIPSRDRLPRLCLMPPRMGVPSRRLGTLLTPIELLPTDLFARRHLCLGQLGKLYS